MESYHLSILLVILFFQSKIRGFYLTALCLFTILIDKPIITLVGDFNLGFYTGVILSEFLFAALIVPVLRYTEGKIALCVVILSIIVNTTMSYMGSGIYYDLMVYHYETFNNLLFETLIFCCFMTTHVQDLLNRFSEGITPWFNRLADRLHNNKQSLLSYIYRYNLNLN